MNQDKTATADRLVVAAWRTVAAHGLRGATSRRITDEAGANLGAITYHFGSKNELLAAAAARGLRDLFGPLGEALLADERSGGSARTDATILALVDAYGDARGEARALLEIALAGDELPGAAAAIQAEVARFHDLVAGHLRRLQARGDVPDTVQPEAMAGMFTAFALGLVLHDRMGTAPAPLLAILGQLLSLLTPPT